MLDSYKFIVLSPHIISKESKPYIEAAYKTYKSVWNETFSELKLNKKVYANPFMEQHHILCIFHNEICVATIMLRRLDLSLSFVFEDSWLKEWEEEEFKYIRSKGDEFLISSYLTVHPDYRKTRDKKNSIPLSSIIGSLAMLYQKKLGIECMLGITRNNRSVDNLALSWGGKILRKGVKTHNTEGCLVAFCLDNLHNMSQNFDSKIFALFENRIDYSKHSIKGDYEIAS